MNVHRQYFSANESYMKRHLMENYVRKSKREEKINFPSIQTHTSDMLKFVIQSIHDV